MPLLSFAQPCCDIVCSLCSLFSVYMSPFGHCCRDVVSQPPRLPWPFDSAYVGCESNASLLNTFRLARMIMNLS